MAMVCMLGYSATSGAMPFIIERVFDDVFGQKDRTTLSYLPFVIVAVFSFRGLTNFGQSYLTDYVGLRIVTDIRNAIYRHLQFLPLSFFQQHPTGTLISRVNTDVALVRSALTDSVASLMRDTTSLLVLLGVAFLKDWIHQDKWVTMGDSLKYRLDVHHDPPPPLRLNTATLRSRWRTALKIFGRRGRALMTLNHCL